MLSVETFKSLIRFEAGTAERHKILSDVTANVKIKKVTDENGNWHLQLKQVIPEEVAQSLSDVVESLKKHKLNEDVFQKINK